MRLPSQWTAAAVFIASIAMAAGADTFQQWEQEGAVKRPYIFTQQHNVENRPDAGGRVQLIRLGYPLQVQLPANPAIWTFEPEASAFVEFRGGTMVYSPNRIDGTESILVFDLALSPYARDGTEGQLAFRTDDLPASLQEVVPGGVYVVRFRVIDPD